MCRITIITVVLLVFYEGACQHGTRMSYNGCFTASELSSTELSEGIDIEHNYPGLCVDMCYDIKQSNPVAVALKRNICLCLKRNNTKSSPETPHRNCRETCPGHNELYCGSGTANCYSVYRVHYTAINVSEEVLCTGNVKDTHSLTMINCSNRHYTFCYKVVDGSCSEDETPAKNWFTELLKCADVPYNSEGILKEAECASTNGVIGFSITTIFWIPAFGKYAPPVHCPALPDPAGGNVTVLSNPRFVVYTCFQHQPSMYRFCMANGTWNGTTPVCTAIATTTEVEMTTSATSLPTTKTIPYDTTNVSTTSVLQTTVSDVSTTSTAKLMATEDNSSDSGLGAGAIAGNSGLGAGAIAGIVIGTLVAVVGIIVVVVLCYKNFKEKKQQTSISRQSEHTVQSIKDQPGSVATTDQA